MITLIANLIFSYSFDFEFGSPSMQLSEYFNASICEQMGVEHRSRSVCVEPK